MSRRRIASETDAGTPLATSWAKSSRVVAINLFGWASQEEERENVMVRRVSQNKVSASTLADRPDEDLLLSYADSGDSLLFTELVMRYERELYGYLHRFLGHRELAKDVLQATFLQLHLKCDSFQPGRPLRPWLFAIATNQAIDALRSQRKHWGPSIDAALSGLEGECATLSENLQGSRQEPCADAHLNECRAGVRQAVDQLPLQLRQIVRLIYFDGLKYREAAEALALPLGTVKSRMHSAFDKLQRQLHYLAS